MISDVNLIKIDVVVCESAKRIGGKHLPFVAQKDYATPVSDTNRPRDRVSSWVGEEDQGAYLPS
jgi:hypothetical protein